ncbi:MAG: hypothetical protein LBV45_04070 [Xanthomonadaceae bacterium]|nr:hypothetical protein [Xanthomonadaceae bacterium]
MEEHQAPPVRTLLFRGGNMVVLNYLRLLILAAIVLYFLMIVSCSHEVEQNQMVDSALLSDGEAAR